MNTNQIGVYALALSLCLATSVTAQEHNVKPKDVPAVVVAAAVKAFPSAKIVEWAKETEGGKTLFEASMTEGPKKRDVLLTPDGKIDAVEEIIAMSEVPTAVQNALKTKYPKAIVQTAERITRGSEVQYELALKNAPKKEVVYTPDGKLLKEE